MRHFPAACEKGFKRPARRNAVPVADRSENSMEREGRAYAEDSGEVSCTVCAKSF